MEKIENKKGIAQEMKGERMVIRGRINSHPSAAKIRIWTLNNVTNQTPSSLNQKMMTGACPSLRRIAIRARHTVTFSGASTHHSRHFHLPPHPFSLARIFRYPLLHATWYPAQRHSIRHLLSYSDLHRVNGISI